jgi:hypothetical protein
MKQHTRKYLVLLVVLTALSLVGGAANGAAPATQALWVFSDEVSDAGRRATLVERSAASGVDTLYQSIYRSTPNSAGRYMFEDSDLAALIRQAKSNQMRVWAAYGAPDWPTLGCAPAGFPMQRMAEVVAYNKANPSAKLWGVMLDVEPAAQQGMTDFPALLDLYGCIRQYLPNSIRLGVAIRFYWDELVAYPAGGPVKPVYQHIIDMKLDQVVVMGYRDTAGAPCPANGIICLDEDEIAYADSRHKNGLILVGLETSNCAPGCGPEYVTFFEEGQSALNQEAGAVANHFAPSHSFGGFAIHRCGDAYLSDQSGWPATNPSFP